MDAIVTIDLMQGKKTEKTITAAVELPDLVADLLTTDPGFQCEWIFVSALKKIKEDLLKPTAPAKKVAEPEKESISDVRD
jgi:hypothetical protein